MRKFIIIAIIFVAGCAEQAQDTSTSTTLKISDNITSRSFDMGFVPIPKQPLTTEAWLEAWDILEINADVVLHHANTKMEDWEQFAKGMEGDTESIGSLNFISGMASRKGLKLFLVVDPLIPNREEISSLPPSWGKNFGDPKVRQGFLNYARRIARDYKPEYVGIFSEINTYMLKHPNDAENVVSLYEETYKAVKQESPKTKITTTFQYESLSGMVDGTTHWEILDKFKTDVVAITTYPSPWFESPDKIPEEYYKQLTAHANKPVIIAESGWPTRGNKYHGSEKNQEMFIRRFPELTKDLDMEVWIWWFLHDWEGEGYPDFFKTMGLRESDGSEKPSWRAWREIYGLVRK